LKKIFLTGASGKLGSYLYPILNKNFKILAVSSKKRINYINSIDFLNKRILIKNLVKL